MLDLTGIFGFLSFIFIFLTLLGCFAIYFGVHFKCKNLEFRVTPLWRMTEKQDNVSGDLEENDFSDWAEEDKKKNKKGK